MNGLYEFLTAAFSSVSGAISLTNCIPSFSALDIIHFSDGCESGSLRYPPPTMAGQNFAFRKRLDGGYSVAQKNANLAHIVPDSFRLFRQFLPAFKSEGNEIRLRFGRPFFKELLAPTRWTASEPSPFEKTRNISPAPSQPILDEGLKNLAEAFPMFTKAKILETWGCAIDVTPDAVPVISELKNHSGIVLASGFSGARIRHRSWSGTFSCRSR